MGFSQENLSPIGGSADGRITWEYITNDAPSVPANQFNYFGSASDLLSVGDLLFIKSSRPIGISAIVTQSDDAQVQLGTIQEITI
jgi:hypothetical protein